MSALETVSSPAVTATGLLDDEERFIRLQCAELERKWLAEHKNASTRRAYRRNIRAWFDWCFDNDTTPLSALREHSALWSADLAEIFQPSSVNQHLSAMNGWYEFGLDEYPQAFRIARSPWRKKHTLEVSDESQTLGLDLEEARAFRQVSWEYGTVDAAVSEILLGCGLRSGELEAANIASLGRQRGHHTLRVRRKRNKLQTIVLPPRADRAVAAHLATRPGARPTDPLILCPDGKRLTNRRIDGIVKRNCRAARITVISPHGLRHTCASLLLDAKVPLRRVQILLGHADPRTTARYDSQLKALAESPVYDLDVYLAA